MEAGEGEEPDAVKQQQRRSRSSTRKWSAHLHDGTAGDVPKQTHTLMGDSEDAESLILPSLTFGQGQSRCHTDLKRGGAPEASHWPLPRRRAQPRDDLIEAEVGHRQMLPLFIGFHVPPRGRSLGCVQGRPTDTRDRKSDRWRPGAPRVHVNASPGLNSDLHHLKHTHTHTPLVLGTLHKAALKK